MLHRRTPLGEPIDVDAVAASLRLEPAMIDHALLRLATESLVEKGASGGYTPTPMTAALVDKLYGDRVTIVNGVIERHLCDATDEQLQRIRRLSDLLLTALPTSAATLEQFLELNLDYHAAIVDLAGSRKLTASFRALNVATVWRETYEADDWQRRLGPTFVPTLTEALERRDVAEAQRIVREQVEVVKDGAKRVIAAHGGAV